MTMEVPMAVQVQMTWTFVGDEPFQVTSEFGHIELPAEEDPAALPTIDRVLVPESSSVGSGLARQIA
jgi:hypothetical protein